MNRALLAATVGLLLLMAGFTQGMASPIVASYSGSNSIVTSMPASEGIVSLRIRIEPLFADCTAPGQCTELLQVDGVGDVDSGISFSLNLGTVLDAISDGTQLFAFSLNFGSTYSDAASGGGVGLFTSSLGDLYSGQPLDSATFTIDRLFFSPVNAQFGTGTRAMLEYTLALHGPDADFGFEVPAVDFLAESDSLTPAVANPEPASWLMVAVGVGAVWAIRRKQPAR